MNLQRVLPWALLLSLALNLFIGGVIFSHHHLKPGDRDRDRHRVHSQRHGVLPHPRELRRALSESGQARLDARHESHKPLIRERLKAVGQAKQEITAALRSEPFDRARLDAAFAGVREQEAQLATEMHAMFGALAAELDAADRARLAGLIPTRRHRGPEQTERAP